MYIAVVRYMYIGQHRTCHPTLITTTVCCCCEVLIHTKVRWHPTEWQLWEESYVNLYHNAQYNPNQICLPV
jgi:hypothetical protein